MKALSIRQPWTALILAGVKPIENRTWGTRYRGRILLHAGRQSDDTASLTVVRMASELDRKLLARGGILGSAELVDVLTDADTHPPVPGADQWAVPGVMHWLLRDPVIFEEPIPYRGALGLFNVPDEVLPLVAHLNKQEPQP